MKKIIILFSVFCSLLFVSCSDNDDYENEINKQISISRTESICKLLKSVALYPDDETYLDNTANLSLGLFDPSNIQDEETEGVNRGNVMIALFESMSYNPSATERLSEITEKYIGAYNYNSNSDPKYFSDDIINIAIAHSTGSYIAAIRAISNKSYSDTDSFKYISAFKYVAQKFLGFDYSTSAE